MTKEAVAQLVRQHLQNHARPDVLDGIALDVLEDDIYSENDYWRVPILPSTQPRWMYAFYEVLAEVESELQENIKLNVLLVPVVPEEVIPIAV